MWIIDYKWNIQYKLHFLTWHKSYAKYLWYKQSTIQLPRKVCFAKYIKSFHSWYQSNYISPTRLSYSPFKAKLSEIIRKRSRSGCFISHLQCSTTLLSFIMQPFSDTLRLKKQNNRLKIFPCFMYIFEFTKKLEESNNFE